jgi:MFS family permease
MSFYLNAINGGNTIGPLICGFIVTSLSWRWHKWIAFILTFINFLVVLFFCPETRYARSGIRTISASEGVSGTSSSEDVTSTEKEVSANAKEVGDANQIPRKTFVQNLSLWSGTPKETNLFKLFIRPLPLIVYPAVILSFLGFAVSLAVSVSIKNIPKQTDMLTLVIIPVGCGNQYPQPVCLASTTIQLEAGY